MTPVLVWKVYREHRLLWAAMAALALGLLVLVLSLADPGTETRILNVLFTMIAYTYGMVVGALLLAGEREAGTATFLDLLPGKRLAVWQVKCATGAVLVLAQVLFLWVVLLANGAFRDLYLAAVLLEVLLGFAFMGFAWGLFFSGRTQTAMGAILAGVVTQFVAAPLVVGLCLGIIRLLQAFPMPPWAGEVITINGICGLLILVPIVVSAVGQARVDRLRRLDASENLSTGGWRSQVAALLWLDLRQAGKLFRWLGIIAICAGSFLPLGVLYWPFLTLLLGVLAGVAVFAGEQTEGSARFLSEQRLPPGRVWAVKVGLHLVLAVGVALLLLIPAAARLTAQSMRRAFTNEAPSSDFDLLKDFLQLGPYLTLFLGYGFSVGCLCGLLLRKPVVAGVIAGGVALMLAALWAPSLLVGGVHAWQIWGTPILLLLTTRLLIWPWATGRLGSLKAVAWLATGLLLAGLWFAGAIGYRVVEIPLVEDKLDLPGFEQALEGDRRNEAGQHVRDVLKQIANSVKGEGNTLLRPLFPDKEPGKVVKPTTFTSQLDEVVKEGWPPGKPDLDARLDEAFRQPWARPLSEVVKLPLGVVEDMQGRTLVSPSEGSGYAYLAARLLVARGLQLQAHGDPAAFVDNLAIGLALVRQVRHRAPTAGALWRMPEEILFMGLEHWLEHLGNRPILLRKALDLLIEHDRATEEKQPDRLRANYLVALNTVNQPEPWIREAVMWQRRDTREPLAAMVALAWQVPWEQTRLQRIVRYLANKREKDSLPVPETLSWIDGSLPWHVEGHHEKTWRRVLEVMLALRLSQAETGHPAKTLQELTPKILASLPVDPATDAPFEYRLSKGEELAVSMPGLGITAKVPRKIAPGQGILTSKYKNFVIPLPAAR